MSAFTGLLIISGLAFLISMLVACIIWVLSLFTTQNEMLLTGIEKPTPNSNYLLLEWQHFKSFQKHYRTYWHNKNVVSNELIDFYCEQY